MKGCNRANAFDLVDVAARSDEALSEQGRAGAIPKQNQTLRLREADVVPRDLGACLAIGGTHPSAG